MIRPVLGAVALFVAVAMGGTAAAQSDYEAPGCFWLGPNDPDVINIAYPDTGARYWIVRPPVVDLGELVFRGTFPHARYMSLNVYDENLAPVDGLADVEIVPDEGSENPFLLGADRTGENRSFTLRVVPGPKPETPEPNTIYLSLAGRGSPVSPWVMYRVYLPDEGRDLRGDADIPSVELHMPDGTVVDMTAGCDQERLSSPPFGDGRGEQIAALFNDEELPAIHPFPARQPAAWQKFYNLPYLQWQTYVGALGDETGVDLVPYGTPLIDAAEGGYLSNRDNAYVATVASRSYGDVLVVKGKAPIIPLTYDGRVVMGDQDGDGEFTTGEGATPDETPDLRYWSLCTNERHSTRHIDCAIDQFVPIDADGNVTIVVASTQDIPSLKDCGFPVLRWGTSPEVALILRHMLPEPDFDEAIQRVEGGEDKRATMGPYLPTVTYATVEEFNATACP